MALPQPIEGVKCIVFRGYVSSDFQQNYICPPQRTSVISSIRLINKTTSDKVVRAQYRFANEVNELVPSGYFILKGKHTAELIDDNQEIGLLVGDTLELAAEDANSIKATIVVTERIA